jgi:transposase
MSRKIKRKAKAKVSLPPGLESINRNAAAIDIGSAEHYVAVPPERSEEAVRSFGSYTAGLHEMARWLKECAITTVALESTGSYWIAPYQILEASGLEVVLVNSRHVKNLPGRKSDVLDCQWLQKLHTHGLLSGSFRPEDKVCVLRSYLRHRENLVRGGGAHIQHMQKALTEMNLSLHHVLSDLTGQSALAMIRAILAGERDPWKLAALKNNRVKKPKEEIARCLEGDYRSEHLFALAQALELYEFYQAKIAQCDQQIEEQLHKFEARIDVEAHPLPEKAKKKTLKAQGDFELKNHLYAICGVDLTRIDGLEVLSVQALLSEIGLDMTRWKSEKHFASWLNLAPPTRISGGKPLARKPHRGHNRAADILRLCAQSALKSKSALGAFGRRLRARLDAPTAIKAVAHKLARIVYRMLKYGQEYRDAGERYYEEKYQAHLLRRLQKQAAAFGFQLAPKTRSLATVS